MASQSFFHRARAQATVEGVWRELQGLAPWKQIGGVSQITDEHFDELHDLVGYRFKIVVGGMEYEGTARRVSTDRLRRVVMGIDSSILSGEIAVDLKPDEGATWVELSLSMTSKGFMSALLFPAIASAVAGGFGEVADDFVNSLSP